MKGVPISPIRILMCYLDRIPSVSSAYIHCLLDVYILFVRRAAPPLLPPPPIWLAASLAGKEEDKVKYIY